MIAVALEQRAVAAVLSAIHIAVEQRASTAVLSAILIAVEQRASAAVRSAILLQWYWDVPLLPDNVFLFSSDIQILILKYHSILKTTIISP